MQNLFLILTAWIFVGNFFAYGQSKISMKELKKQVNTELAAQKGNFAVAFKDITKNKTLLVNAQESFHAASTMKTPVMIEVFKQASEKRISLNDSIQIKNKFKSIADNSSFSLDSANDSEREIYKHIGEKRSIYQLMYDMIITSSNFATNLIIEKVGAKNVTHTMRSLGAKKIQVLRGVEDGKAYELGLNNTTTAYDLMLIFEKIAKGKAVNKEASDSMVKILSAQTHNDIIPAELPQDVKVAHKTGSITGVQHDSGIIYLPDGRKYVLILLSKNLVDEKASVKMLAHISKMIYDYLK